jgi:Tfp pilus assembly protein PilN
MNNRPPLNLNLATRPRRNRRLYAGLCRGLAALLVVLAALAAFVVLKFGGESARLRTSIAEARKIEEEAKREDKRLTADIRAEERLSRVRVDLVNSIILKKTFSWTRLFSELEAALPGPSYITLLTPNFTEQGSVALRLRVMSRNLDDVRALIDNLNVRGFKNIQVFRDTRADDGRVITEISLTYERYL